MKVLFISNFPSPYRVDFFNELGKKCDLTVLFEEGIEEQKHRDKKWFNDNYSNFNAIFLKSTKIYKSKSICLSIKDYLNGIFDLILVGNYSTLTGMYAINFLKWKKIKFALVADGALRKSGKGFREKLKKTLISSANWWFSTSEQTDDYFIFYGADKRGIYRYPFTSLYEKEVLDQPASLESKQKYKIELGINEEKVILSIGQFIYRKGFDVLIRGCKELPCDVGVYIIGGKAPESYQYEMEKLGLENIHFVDFKPKAELKKYLMASDLFVLPTREDIWGLVINEAMAFGLPVITTDKCVAGIELIENDKNGYIVPVDDAIVLGEKMRELIQNDNLRNAMAIKNLKKIKEYTIENMVTVHLNIFEEIQRKKIKSDL